MATRWQPSQKTQLTLRQLGFSRHQVNQAVTSYVTDSRAPDEKAFFQHLARNGAVGRENYQALLTAAKLPLNWQVERSARQILLSQGFTSEVIDHYRDLFVIRVREQGRVVRHPDIDFLKFCRRHPKQLAGPISEDWQPDAKTLQRLHRDHVNLDAALSFVPEFVLYWRDSARIASDWQQVFYKQALTYATARQNPGVGEPAA